MKHTISVIIRMVLVVFLVTSCANWGGNNPMGVTGGSDQGYGKGNDLDLPSAGSYSSENDLIGTWRHDYGGGDYETLEFKSNGKFEMAIYENYNFLGSIEGDYSTSGSSITLSILGEQITGTYSISGNELTLYIEGESTTYYRV